MNCVRIQLSLDVLVPTIYTSKYGAHPVQVYLRNYNILHNSATLIINLKVKETALAYRDFLCNIF